MHAHTHTHTRTCSTAMAMFYKVCTICIKNFKVYNFFVNPQICLLIKHKNLTYKTSKCAIIVHDLLSHLQRKQ